MKHVYKTMKRFFIWGWRLRNSYEFDSHTLLQMEVMKLKDLLNCFKNYGHHSEECPNYRPKMKSIRLAIKVGEKLVEDNYTKFYDLHYKKWGKVDMIVRDTGKAVFERNGRPHEPSKEERKELLAAFSKDEKMKQKHRKLFYNIIAEHGERWWD